MPIYAYRCTTCGHAKDVLQKVSDPLLTDCPACGAATFVKQVTAAGFQLKGSGWYVTDFRGGNSGTGKPDGEAAPKEAGSDKGGAEKPAEKAADKAVEKAPAAAPAPAASAPAAPAAPTPPAASPPTSGS
ncbi:MAG: zinc ribbon domain-containing protein [Rubrivivax sp.]|nr:zinc ribbon domain-containing protein [Rubrivivax sp.]